MLWGKAIPLGQDFVENNMGRTIARSAESGLSVTIDTSAGSSTVVPYGSYSGGTIYVPTGSSITTLTFYAIEHSTGTPVAMYDTSNAAVTMTVAADRAYPVPDDMYGCQYWTAIGNATGTVTVARKS